MGNEPEKFKASIVYLVPVLASMLFGLLCGTLLVKPTPSSPPAYPVTPISQTTTAGSAFNAAYFVILIGVGAVVIYLLIKYRSRRTLTFLTGFALTAAFMLLSLVYFSELFSRFTTVTDSLPLIIALSAVVTVIGDFVVFRLGGKASDVLVLCIGGALGVFLGANLNVTTAVLVLAALAVYDVVAVYRGPVGKIADSGLEQLRGLSFAFKDIQMGLGDLVFYSLLTGTMFININLAAALFSVIGILLGSYLTFLMLERRDIFPGLPIPLATGIALGLLASLI
ncbi:MAG: presenilin [Candidatus Bathyarchaeota archaeon]|nr:presenilin [Candidatus Bathyarchaeota archaeon]